ncbi:MAG: lectin MVL [Bacteroidetes bacterium]|nr:MAG: lectin MVL [Bacteroidota bacterium]
MSTFTIDIPAGPLWNDEDAKEKAPKVAAAHQGKWNGQWKTVVASEMSVIGVELQVQNTGSHSYKTNVLAGPLWSNDEAQKVGPAIAASYGATFTGQWSTITEGVMSVIEIEYKY